MQHKYLLKDITEDAGATATVAGDAAPNPTRASSPLRRIIPATIAVQMPVVKPKKTTKPGRVPVKLVKEHLYYE